MTSEDKYALKSSAKNRKSIFVELSREKHKHTGVVVVMFQGENRIL
jgi:hypothetical protein